jgi:hypothetical protein
VFPESLPKRVERRLRLGRSAPTGVQPSKACDLHRLRLGSERRSEHGNTTNNERAPVHHCSENDMSMGGVLMLLVRGSRGSPELRAGESRDV